MTISKKIDKSDYTKVETREDKRRRDLKLFLNAEKRGLITFLSAVDAVTLSLNLNVLNVLNVLDVALNLENEVGWLITLKRVVMKAIWAMGRDCE